MNKKIVLILVSVLCIGISGCGNKGADKSVKDEAYALLAAGEWAHYDPNIGEMEILHFTEEDEFYYHCACGEPIGDSDLYDKYFYDGNGKIAIRCSFDKDIKEIDTEILYLDEKTLFIRMGEDIIEFFNEEKVKSIWEDGNLYNCDTCIEYMRDNDAYDAVVEIREDELVISPTDYDADVSESAGYLRNVKIAEDAEFYELKVDSVVNDSGILEKHACTYNELSKEDVVNMLDASDAAAYIWYNDEVEISKIVFYGAAIVYE